MNGNWLYEGKLDMLYYRLAKLKQLRVEARDLGLSEKHLDAEMDSLYTQINKLEVELAQEYKKSAE